MVSMQGAAPGAKALRRWSVYRLRRGASDHHLSADLDDSVGRDLEEVGRVRGRARERDPSCRQPGARGAGQHRHCGHAGSHCPERPRRACNRAALSRLYRADCADCAVCGFPRGAGVSIFSDLAGNLANRGTGCIDMITRTTTDGKMREEASGVGTTCARRRSRARKSSALPTVR